MTTELVRSCNSQHTDQKSLQSIDVEPEFQVKQVPVTVNLEKIYSQQPQIIHAISTKIYGRTIHYLSKRCAFPNALSGD